MQKQVWIIEVRPESFRDYDSDVARFLSLDPLAAEFPAWSDYNYVLGNPVMFIDPDGKAPKNQGVDSQGNIIFDDKKNDGNVYLLNEGSNNLNEKGLIPNLKTLKENSKQLVSENEWTGTPEELENYVLSQWKYSEGGFDWLPHTGGLILSTSMGRSSKLTTTAKRIDGENGIYIES